jgi:hypothetical protein
VNLLSAENPRHFVAFGAIAGVVVSPLWLVAPIIVVLFSEILTSLLTPIWLILRIKLLRMILRDSFNIVFFLFLLDGLDPGTLASSFKQSLNCG